MGDRPDTIDASWLLPYIYVDHIDDTVTSIGEHGREVSEGPYPEGDRWAATFRDPAGQRPRCLARGER